MKNAGQLDAATLPASQDLIEIGLALLAQRDPSGATPAIDWLNAFDATAADAPAIALAEDRLVRLLAGFIETFERGLNNPTLTALGQLAPAQASAGTELLLKANFPDGNTDFTRMGDSVVLLLAALLARAGLRNEGWQLTGNQMAIRTAPVFATAGRALQAWISSGVAGPGQLWTTRLPDRLEAPAAAPVTTGLAVLDAEGTADALIALLRQARAAAEQGDAEAALGHFSAGLVLPTHPASAATRRALVADLAAYCAYLRAIGAHDAFNLRRLNMALMAQTPTALAAAAWLAEQGERLALPADAISTARQWFEAFGELERQERAYVWPRRGDKPFIDTVWLEITNYCNQKCTFCPDMHREDARQWLPFDKIRETIDQLAETVHVGSMQLNAYGEPLLHPQIAEILAYINERKLPFPTFFTTHGLTLVEKKLKQLSNNYPQGIAVSLHNDSQESYALSRSAKIGDYHTMCSRIEALFRQMVRERAPTHLRLYQMVSNGNEDQRVAVDTRRAFPDTPERMIAHFRKWERIALAIAADAPGDIEIRIQRHSDESLRRVYANTHDSFNNEITIFEWRDVNNNWQPAFISTRPVGTYANLLLEYDRDWRVERNVVNSYTCGFTNTPSLAIFATGRLGLCCLDLNSQATFGSLDDYADIRAAVESPEARAMMSELANGVALTKGCQICLSSGTSRCG